MTKHADIFTAALVGSLAAWVFYPGMMSNDSINQYHQALSGVFTDWHPPLMAWIWRQLNRVYPGPQQLLFLHLALYQAGAVLFARSLTARPLVRAGVVALLTLLPPIFGLIGTIWKDVGFMAGMLLAAGALARGRTWLAIAAMIFAVGVRLNGVVAIAPLCVWIALAHRKLWHGAAAAIAIVVVAFGASALLTTERLHAEQQVMIHDLTALSLANETVLLPPPYDAKVDLAGLRQHYRANNMGLLVFSHYVELSVDADEVARLRRAWRRAIVASPLAYLRHRWAAYESLLNLTPGPVCYPHHFGMDPDPLLETWRPRPIFVAVTGLLAKATETPLYRSWLYLVFCAVAVVASVRRSRAAVCIGASGLLYALSYFPTAPACDFRYLSWTIVAAVCALAAAVASRLRPAA